ncbi:MAG TPA: hypothetical protein VK716_17695 [Terracidiphilus sp.]|jgi:hypothetical protein|nr:hypothetical protein [Terracidiphilus sp.]
MGPAEVAATPSHLIQAVETYLAEHPTAVLLQDGEVAFDMRAARYSISESHGRCLLQVWSDERNLFRTVVQIAPRAHALRLITRRLGVDKPQTLEFLPSADRRTATSRNAGRNRYLKLLDRVLRRNFIGYRVDGLRSAMDLEHSFGPAYARGRLLCGTTAEAIIGISSAESVAAIDGILTLGILWLEYCREHGNARRHYGAIKVIVPTGFCRTTADRMAWLNDALADFQLFTLNEHTEELTAVDFRDTGNVDAHLVHAFSTASSLEICRSGIGRLIGLVPAAARQRVELQPRSPNEVSLLLHGLEFARVRHGVSAHSFTREDEIAFGAGAHETLLTSENEPLCRDLFERLFLSRHPDGSHTDALFRLQPERWLESRLRGALAQIFPQLRADLLYSQVPALSAGDRGMLDLLTLDHIGRLVILELKANEDLHLPMQALDYWIRVRSLNQDRAPGAGGRLASAFERSGYFQGVEVSPLPPRLILAAPALRIHPANQVVLQYLAPEVEWEFVALAENWRHHLAVVTRKRSCANQV